MFSSINSESLVITASLLSSVQENAFPGPPMAEHVNVALPLSLALMTVGSASTLPSGETVKHNREYCYVDAIT